MRVCEASASDGSVLPGARRAGRRSWLLLLGVLCAGAAPARGADAPAAPSADAVAGVYAPDLAESVKRGVAALAQAKGVAPDAVTAAEVQRIRDQVREFLQAIDVLLFVDPDGAYEFTARADLAERIESDPNRLRRGRWSLVGASAVFAEAAASATGTTPGARFEGSWDRDVLLCPSVKGGPPDPYRRISAPLHGSWRVDYALCADRALDPTGMRILTDAGEFLPEREDYVKRLRQRWPTIELDLDKDGAVRSRLARVPSEGAPAELTPSRGTWTRVGRHIVTRMLYERGRALEVPTSGPPYSVMRLGRERPEIVLTGQADKDFRVFLRRVPEGR